MRVEWMAAFRTRRWESESAEAGPVRTAQAEARWETEEGGGGDGWGQRRDTGGFPDRCTGARTDSSTWREYGTLWIQISRQGTGAWMRPGTRDQGRETRDDIVNGWREVGGGAVKEKLMRSCLSSGVVTVMTEGRSECARRLHGLQRIQVSLSARRCAREKQPVGASKRVDEPSPSVRPTAASVMDDVTARFGRCRSGWAGERAVVAFINY